MVHPSRRGQSNFLSGYKSQVFFSAVTEVAHTCGKVRMKHHFALWTCLEREEDVE